MSWDDSEDDWDVDDAELDKKLSLRPAFAEEVDLAVTEKKAAEKARAATLKKKGNALTEKKKAEEQRKEEIELARKAMSLEAEAEANMSAAERRALQQQREQEAQNALADDLFGDGPKSKSNKRIAAGEEIVLTTMTDHLKHATRVSESLLGHGKTHLATAFLKETIQKSKDALDDDAVSELIKVLNVIKNEKVQAAKRKVKGQAQKSKKDKAAEARARKIQQDTFGDNDAYDEYDEMGGDYEDAFF